MIDILYVISEQFNYERLICSDAGPQYAASMNWKTVQVSEIHCLMGKDIHFIIDPRLFETEYDKLYDLICQNPKTEFSFVVTDPCFEQCADKYLYAMLFRCASFLNVTFITQYQPTEMVYFLKSVAKPNSMVVMNYPYVIAREIHKPFAERKHKILFSGAVGSTVYPERYNFWQKYTRSLWRIKIATLAHPGYPSPNEQYRHNKLGSSYVKHLSMYQFMYVSGSRCRLELLKYSECAYAGCVPVGYAPDTFDATLRKYVLPVDHRHLTKSMLRLFTIPIAELADMAKCYREEFARQRNPEVLNQKFETFLKHADSLHLL